MIDVQQIFTVDIPVNGKALWCALLLIYFNQMLKL